jgi:hypothetical protein
MVFEKQIDIEIELREISEFATSVSVVMNDTITLDDYRLREVTVP